MFSWLRRRRRERLRAQPFPTEWLAIIEARVPYFGVLPESSRRELLGHVQVFLHEKQFEGCGGFEMNDEVRVTIAAHACVLLLNRETECYPRLLSVLVYPESFVAGGGEEDPEGMVSEETDVHVGESWDHGVVILAWDEVVQSCKHVGDGYNVVLHEFAHQLDDEESLTDGGPFASALYDRWAKTLERGYTKLVRDVRRNRRTLLDDYGATDPGEFFAVVTETFFELPIELRARHRELYDAMEDYYRQDPAAYIEGSQADY